MYALAMLLMLGFVVSVGAFLVEGLQVLAAKVEGKPKLENKLRSKAILSGVLFVAALIAIVKYGERDKAPELRTAQVEKMIMFCWDQVGKKSKYPSKARFDCTENCAPFGARVSVKQPDGRYLVGIDPTLEPLENQSIRIAGPVEFMNGFGAFIPHEYQCDYENGKPEDIRVSKGR